MPCCKVCNREKRGISNEIGICADCIKNSFEKVEYHIVKVHSISRRFFQLPESVPLSKGGKTCVNCINRCTLAQGERGFCGVRSNCDGDINDNARGNYEWYYDLLPTNCVADWVCPGGTGVGYPEYAHRSGPEYGYRNLAVFMNSCNFNCLFCQNWHFREKSNKRSWYDIEHLSTLITPETSCVCFFGGDPTPQIGFIIKSVEKMLLKKNKILRICFETNGSMSEKDLDRIIELSLQTGGIIKFDLKAWNKNLHRALCGVSNSQTLRNFKRAARYIHKRPAFPLLVASTLLVPGYIDADEIRGIAQFISSIDPTIPYTLLAFQPMFFMDDLPVTSKKHLERCYEIIIETGLKRVKVGNFHLLGNEEY